MLEDLKCCGCWLVAWGLVEVVQFVAPMQFLLSELRVNVHCHSINIVLVLLVSFSF